MSMPRLGTRFRSALGYAATVHATQRRKGTDLPYLGHILAVAALVIEDGGTETEAIAALLHDAAEDAGGRERLAEIERRFGPDVAAIVSTLTDAWTDPKPPWRERKEAYIAGLREAPESVLRVAAADKLHNARAILRDVRTHGEALWERFTADKDATLWYYRAVTDVLQARFSGHLTDELDRTVAAIEAAA
jgi:(p)ppGpp synthase/HD superfamily hydrolase